ncbi:SMP-30/gluconolactonase/LRE family protein [Herbidospora sp. NEAU-GS84]|uniref:SMP-30/gluconolactonase/LRE family protein n=1 Tax=Herbidospora solisilvae TaxID=2696284 RepID=A0A7C9NAK8_9ACTN|nr:SMP-30/gluconolactonase/LRE family protein [Herbidospora solisilvae]NAS25893.1 SMP-30/gluconolactonase/LRE family protein [Herbidospora solisilvae]
MSPPPRSRRRRVLIGAAAVLVVVPVLAVPVFLLAVPPPIADFHPEAWTPGAAITIDSSSQTEVKATPIMTEAPYGPEDIAIDDAGAVYTGDRDGNIIRVAPDGSSERFAEVGGRPLGLAFDADQNLIIANHGAGLQSVSPNGTVTLLAGEAGGRPILFANDLVIGSDGVIWFTDSSSRYNTTTLGDMPSYLVPDFVDGRPTGRLLRYDPATASISEVLDELYFPNGIAFDADEEALRIAESTRYRILEYSLENRERDVLIDDLPGVPDGMNVDADGSLLVALYDRSEALDSLIFPTALAREIMIRLPGSLFVNEENPLTGGVLVLEPGGTVRHWYRGLDPAATNVVPHDGRWYVGALLGQPVRVLPAP